ncbi:hypothetical protein FSP39_006886 [Pinctada imbricata]|uniref:Fibrinogen C-terminal domain-containing protein n=1 Tax=Pinctada imbricata TaxID=66713 RepID=A0AA89BNU0_PINIB|nr:hypothetical protein FSP39_006886 [Pinctada imbricata]
MPSLGCGAILVAIVYVFSLVKASTNHRSFQQEGFVQKMANVHSQNCPPNVKKVSIGDLNMIKCSLACLEGGECNVFMYKDDGACYIGEDLNTSDDPGTVQMDDIYRLYLEVFQRRKDGSVNFNLNWADYKAGFGTIENYWIGNDMLHMLTASQDTELYVIMRDWNCDVYYARYTSFWTASEVDGYRLTINGYSGTAGDAMSYNNGRRFTTKDRDYDGGVSDNCAVRFHDGGWWFNYCTITDLNGRYVQGMVNDDRSMHWKRIHGERYALESAVMMVRRR